MHYLEKWLSLSTRFSTNAKELGFTAKIVPEERLKTDNFKIEEILKYNQLLIDKFTKIE
jgi:hypothetical protein